MKLNDAINKILDYELDEEHYSTMPAEFWKNEEWRFFDDVLQNNKNWSPEKAEQEALFMIESFLMGVSIDEVRNRYADQIIKQPEVINEQEHTAENVLSFRPK